MRNRRYTKEEDALINKYTKNYDYTKYPEKRQELYTAIKAACVLMDGRQYRAVLDRYYRMVGIKGKNNKILQPGPKAAYVEKEKLVIVEITAQPYQDNEPFIKPPTLAQLMAGR